MTPTEYEMQATHLRRKLAEAEQRLRMLKEDGHVTDAERRVLDMWPRFEDGEPVMVGDRAEGLGGELFEIAFRQNRIVIWDKTLDGFLELSDGERLKRPAPEVFDADGAPIRVGDALRHLCGGSRVTVTEVRPDGLVRARRPDGGESLLLSERLTRREPDSWERLEGDIRDDVCEYFGTQPDSDLKCRLCPHFHEDRDCTRDMVEDIVRRAKALAGIEVAR